MKNHIIIEGPDGAGKTTLAKSYEGYAYHHEGPPPMDVSAFVHYARTLLSATEPMVFDRFHLGELVYGPILRQWCGLKSADVSALRRLVIQTHSIVIVCLPPWEVTQENTRGRKEMLTPDQRLRAYRIWELVAQQEEAAIYDYTKDYLNGQEPPS